ncbi:hypothetical protein C1646_773957 [Rhizophagus diaphanus]|nr:hypothetical protein C1646_773957 [Rhizophagus diaphanus] [Rhizophagus sp. MUCL 43196]
MEYGINFSNDSANENILSALEELNSTFFIENNSSSDEKNVSDNEVNPNFDDVEDGTQSLVENFNEMRINNLEFVENSDSYIEDKVYDDIKLKIKEFFDKGKCSCNSKCFKKIGYERFLTRQTEFESLNKNMRDMALVGVGHTYLDNIIKHLREYGLEERIHGNTGNVLKNMNRVEVNYDIAYEIYNFLKNYSDIHSLPSSRQKFSKITTSVVFLLTNCSYSSVYRIYVQVYKEKYGEEKRIVSETTFRRIWKSLMPLFWFISLKSDLCETCETMKSEIQYITEHEKKISVTKKYLVHLNHAKQERTYYNINIIRAVKDGKRNPNKTETQISFKSFEGSAHITYDWAQNVHVPYSPQQIGTLFFKSSRKVNLFGVCNTGNFPHTEQTNYVIDEGEMPDDGKQEKRVNCTISLIWNAIQKYNCGEKKLVITCDNCIGQNKNNYFLFFYSWLIDRGMYEEVEMNFMIPGYTKFICDSCFGLIKIFYQKSKVNTVDDMTSIINNSTTVHLNVSQHYLNGEGFQYYNFKDYFQVFKKIPNIQKYHHFYFNLQHPSVIFYKDKLEDSYKETTVHNFFFNYNIKPSIINIKPLSLKRQEELYKEIIPYINLPFHNITCPKPNENTLD